MFFRFSRNLVVFYSPSFLLNNFFSFCSALPLQASLVILGHLLVFRLSFPSVEILSMFLQFVEIFEFIDKTWKLSSIALPFLSLCVSKPALEEENREHCLVLIPWVLVSIGSFEHTTRVQCSALVRKLHDFANVRRELDDNEVSNFKTI